MERDGIRACAAGKCRERHMACGAECVMVRTFSPDRTQATAVDVLRIGMPVSLDKGAVAFGVG